MGASIKGLVFGRQGRTESLMVLSIVVAKGFLSVELENVMRNNLWQLKAKQGMLSSFGEG